MKIDMHDKATKELGKLCSMLSQIINKRGWFNKDEKKILSETLKILNDVLAKRIKKNFEKRC